MKSPRRDSNEQPMASTDVGRHVSYGAVEAIPPPPRGHQSHRCCCPQDLSTLSRDVLFLLVQGVLAVASALLLLTTMLGCALLVPLCGLGVWLFRRLLFRARMVDFCAKADAALVNYVTSDYDQIQIDTTHSVLPIASPSVLQTNNGLSSDRLVSSLDKLSAESAMVLVYLTVIKLVLAVVGFGVANIVIVLPVLLFHELLTHQRVLISSSYSSWEAFCAHTALALVVLVAVMSMDLLVRLSGAATRFFCCERVYTVPLPRRRPLVSASTRTTRTTRPNVVVVRLPPSASGVYAFATMPSSSPTTTSTPAPSRGS